MVLRDRGAERVYALQDGNWNTTALIAAAGVPGKAAGEVIQRMVYNPYGEVFRLNADWTEQLGAPLVAWQHLFQGLKFTEATGLGYVRNRDYSPILGRFIELDPIGFSAGDNNWYRFVGNGPVGRVDPSGLLSFWWHGNWGGQGWCNGSWRPESGLPIPAPGAPGYKPPVDARDACYEKHDRCINRSHTVHGCYSRPAVVICDKALAACLRAVGHGGIESWCFDNGVFH
jgi:RHS repeat-associated protein